ncbi:MAG: hypothetical protein GX620_08575 [Chloroflexi bacterium]|nr:hypothetical protein [Chloroflexota bacterium]
MMSRDARRSSQTILLAIFGRYVDPPDAELPMDGLIRIMEALEFSPGCVRTLVSRVKQNGLLHSRKEGRRSYYSLTEDGLRLAQSYNDPHLWKMKDGWDQYWTIVVYSVPERHRERRNGLRRLLRGQGFGTIAPGIWISPSDVMPKVGSVWYDLHSKGVVEVFRARHQGPSDLTSLVRRAWPQLETVAKSYLEYVTRYRSVLHHHACGNLDAEQCFCSCLCSYCEFAQVVAGDPRLPAVLLPEDWPFNDAQSVFQKMQDALSSPADSFFASVIGDN